MPRFELSARAWADLEAIADYGAGQWGQRQAAAYVSALQDRLRMLASRPQIGRARDDLVTGLRSIRFESHIVFYMPAGFGIHVARILHMRQDAGRHID